MKRKAGPKIVQNESNMLFISNIPVKNNSVYQLIKYFKKYGRIKSIFSYGTNATITFDSADSAKKAYGDSNPYLGNRFVNIFFHNNPELNESDLMKFCDEKIVNDFTKSVNEEVESKIKETTELQKELYLKQIEKHQKIINTTEEIDALRKTKIRYLKEAQAFTGKSDLTEDEQKKLQMINEIIKETNELISIMERNSAR